MDKTLIKIRQNWVLTHPCRSLRECGQMGYRFDFTYGGQPVATVLTVDLFSEPLAWHVQIAWLDEHGKTRPVSSYSDDERVAALVLARSFLDGVGQPEARFLESNDWCVGLGQPLTEAERAIACQRGEVNRILAPHAVAEFNRYDFRNRTTEAGDGVHVPEERQLIYEC